MAESNNNGRRKIVTALSSAVSAFLAITGVHYVIDVMMRGGEFHPNWFEIIFLTIACGIIGYFAPSPEQARKNRENLKNKLFGKK